MPRFDALAPLAPRLTPLALAAVFGCSGAQAQTAPRPAPAASAALADQGAPITVEAGRIRGRPDLDLQAEGDVNLQRGPLKVRADRLNYDNVSGIARAAGQVVIERNEDRFSGTELQLQIEQFEGYFLQPDYFFGATQAGGHAERIDFIDNQRSRLTAATYTSCPTDGSGGPAWLLSMQRLKLDFEADEGVAEGAVLRFYGVPILAAPTFSFPLTDSRKSGWLPPTVNIDNKSGFEVGVPYYWNIAPNRDATLTPVLRTRRGPAIDSEFRYLEPGYAGRLGLDWLPDDRVQGRSRYLAQVLHDGNAASLHYRAEGVRVSDDDYWKDFSGSVPSITPRLLPASLLAERRFDVGGVEANAYARVQRWQVLQSLDAPIQAPYERSPQLGLQAQGGLAGGFEFGLETEANRFIRDDAGVGTALPDGSRLHALVSLARPWRAPGWFVVPRVALNAAAYHTDQALADGRTSASRAIPTTSLDAGLVFERETRWFGRPLRQTLEPRMLYVDTPYRDQSELPNFDSAGKDFNFVSVYSENSFSGVDRVSDAHQLTAGVTTRILDGASGAEALRLGVAQRYLLRDQRLTPNPDGTPGGPAFTQPFSDLLLLGAANLSPRWSLDTTLQYSPDLNQTTRSIVAARYSPGPYRTLSTGYRFTRGLSEQLELGWQWPLYQAPGAPAPGEARRGGVAAAARAAGTSGGACVGTLYGVGRVNYSVRDSRLTDAIAGLEYDAGCWIGRVVAERLSTGRTEATTRLLLQLELVGLSRLGTSPLKALKDNIPGYRLLREEPGASPTPAVYE